MCAACSAPIARAKDRATAGGAHAHDFMNPGGFVFDIRVYAGVDNVRLVGPASSDWSWFPPHLWTMALCDRCHAHLGWAFSKQQGAPPAFYGLIAERLRET